MVNTMSKPMSVALIAPHLNAEYYRTDTPGNCNPSKLDYIRVHTDGSVLIGSSVLTSRYWDGGANIYKDIAEAKSSLGQDNKCIKLPSGSPDGCFIDNQKVLLCEDSGAVSIWMSPEEKPAWQVWSVEKSVSEHDRGALSVDCLEPGKEYVTVGADGNAKVWDISELICLRHYEAHTMAAVGVSVRPNSDDNFATCGCDGYLSLWDKNIDKPAMDLIANDCGIRCLEWLDEFKLVYGDVAGKLWMTDLRNDKPLELTEFPFTVHKLAYNAKNGKLGVLCENSIVSVCEINEYSICNVVYHDRHRHSKFVRGLAWDHAQMDLLHTVGWDREIESHTID